MKQKENKSLFLQQFGDTPQLRVIDFLIDNHFFDVRNPSELGFLSIPKLTQIRRVL